MEETQKYSLEDIKLAVDIATGDDGFMGAKAVEILKLWRAKKPDIEHKRTPKITDGMLVEKVSKPVYDDNKKKPCEHLNIEQREEYYGLQPAQFYTYFACEDCGETNLPE